VAQKAQKLANRKASRWQATEKASRSEPLGNQASNRHKATEIANSQTLVVMSRKAGVERHEAVDITRQERQAGR
jgi:hypothetical protein